MHDDQRHDIVVLRDLVRRYAEVAADPIQDKRRELWRRHNSLEPGPTPVLVRFGGWNMWCREVFGDDALECRDPFFRQWERRLRTDLFHAGIGDDFIFEPWITVPAVHTAGGGLHGGLWGVPAHQTRPDTPFGAWKGDPPIKDWSDMARMHAPEHGIDEEATRRMVERLGNAVGDLIEIDVNRGPVLIGFAGDISTTIASLRGLDRLMIDMYEAPERLHRLLAFMRDGILRNQQQAEDAGHFSLTNHQNQSMPYCRDLEDPKPNAAPRRRKELWGFFAAQEYTVVGPDQHEEFLFRYQLPIMQQFGLTHYGCCEDLTRKIEMLRAARNLRSVGVAPLADPCRCAEQLGPNYVMSWRPNPTDMVCGAFDETRIRRILREGLSAAHANNARIHLLLKDIENVEGEPDRLRRWTHIARDAVGR
ncbi:MAG: hypothetical protein GXP31_10205 [Kiritimatiellaeota bacterium]|nr:hypothetical protein [Kiritimatiellota bacterium]